LQRQANRENDRIDEANLPWLWVLSPTASTSLLNSFKAETDLDNWPSGVYFLGEGLKSAIVVIHQLPTTEETLWLRMLGKGTTQKQAISEIARLPVNHPLRSNVFLLLANLQATLQVSQNIEESDRELAMELSPLVLQWEEEALRRGIIIERRANIENLLRFRFGLIDEQLSGIIEPLLQLPPEEFTVLLLQLSREDLLARFGR
jgi:hypothetical protein